MDMIDNFFIESRQPNVMIQPPTEISDPPCLQCCHSQTNCLSKVACQAFFQYTRHDKWTAKPGNPTKKWYDRTFSKTDDDTFATPEDHRIKVQVGKQNAALNREKIFRAIMAGRSLRDVGDEYGVSYAGVNRIVHEECKSRNPRLYEYFVRWSDPTTRQLWRSLIEYGEEFK